MKSVLRTVNNFTSSGIEKVECKMSTVLKRVLLTRYLDVHGPR